MNTTSFDREDIEYLVENARAGRALGLSDFVHLDQSIGAWHYVRLANSIAATIPRGRILDWGCGFGQMTYLLRRRGFDVVAFDIGPAETKLPGIPISQGLSVVRSTHPTELPFPDSSFDAVLSCGVLEHVDEHSAPGNELLSLREIHRVLRSRGFFPVFQLPQRHSWTEALQRRLKRGYWHPRRFTAAEARRLLHDAGFEVEWLRRYNVLPKNLTGLPPAIRHFYGRFGRQVLRVDETLARIPGLNLIAGVMELLARRST